MTQQLNSEQLRAACLEVARSIAWKDGDAQSAMAAPYAENLYQEALLHEEYMTGRGRDPNFISRALFYIAHSHAIPPKGVDVSWCTDMLAAFIELACPNSIGRADDEDFYRDIGRGIAESRADYET